MIVYTISGPGGIEAEVLPEKGATVVSLRKNGQEFLYRNDENLSSPERPRCGIPFLFPIFGRLKDGKYMWDAREYAMDIHGFGHTSVWEIGAYTPDTLVLFLEAGEQTLCQYPFRFRVTLTFSVASGTLAIVQRFENLGESPMPYNYGFHPYFLTEKPEDIQVELTADMLFDFVQGAKPFGHGTVCLKVPEGAPEAGAALMGVKGPTVLHWTDGRTLTMDFDDSIHTHVLWTQAGKSFLCVEPVNGTADGLNTGNYMTLEPGGVREAILHLIPETA